MAMQQGIIRLSGKLGELISYQRKNKQVVRQMAQPYQLADGPKRSGRDFGEASKNAAYIRKAFNQGGKTLWR